MYHYGSEATGQPLPGWEQTAEQRTLRNSRPTNRRWRALARHDDAVDRAEGRHAAAAADLRLAEEKLQHAPQADAATLADWLAGGERGPRPGSSVYELTRERDAARLLVDAAGLELDRALQRRLEHVESSRPKMLADARQDLNDARDRLLEHARQLTGLRQQLLDCRGTLEWIAAYPGRVAPFGFPTAVALGLRAPVEAALGTAAKVEYAAVLRALAADAAALAKAFSVESGERLGITANPDNTRDAMWSTDPAFKTWAAGELDRARRLAEWTDPNTLAAEADDFRPDP